jgi:molybdopterin/thiamine biosynthesis adenylyltransferase
MLSDAQIERWSRQILVPEIGGRGQARLCAATVALVGPADVTARAADAIERAGPRVTMADGACVEADVVVRWTSTAARPSASDTPTPTVVVQTHATRAIVTAVTASPCAACVGTPALAADETSRATPLAGATERVVAALVAAEVVRLLVLPDAAGRVHHVDLVAGTFTAEPARAAAVCPACGAPA